MKTAVTVLQELMMKLGLTPEYECISQSGPQHSSMFAYRCHALGVTEVASARSKKEAKQEVARVVLQRLSQRGQTVPSPYCLPAPSSASGGVGGEGGLGAGAAAASPTPHSYVALLKDLCDEYKLPTAEWELVGDTGPPHLRHFTVRMRVAMHERHATATTKKNARQLAAAQLYTYLRENLARLTKDFVEEEALVRARAKAMERYVEMRDDSVWRPDLGQKIADYHIDEEKRTEALRVLEEMEAQGAGPERAVEAAVRALGLGTAWSALGTGRASPLALLELAPAAPALLLAAPSRPAAAAAALRYLRLALAPPTPAPTAPAPATPPDH